MMLNKLQVLAFLFILIPSVSWAQVDDLLALKAHLSKYNVVRGKFTQQRHIKMFNSPLVSQGQFVLAKKKGLIWQQFKPFSVELVLAQNRLYQKFLNKPAQIITTEINPVAFYFNRIFLSLFNGETVSLQEQFRLSFDSQEQGWQLTLTPKKAPLNAVFKQITIVGKEYINQLELKELRGDRMLMQFMNQTHQPNNLSYEERQKFAL